MKDEVSNGKLETSTKTARKIIITKLQDLDPSLNWHNFDRARLNKLEQKLRNYAFIKAGQEKKLSLSRVEQFFKVLRRYCREGILHGYMKEEDSPFKGFDWRPYRKAAKQAKKGRSRRVLTGGEIAKLEALQGLTGFIKHVQDFALMQIYTGLSMGDMQSLDATKIKHHKAGLVIEAEREKTGEPFDIPLYLLFDGKPERMMKEYLDKCGSDKFFPLVEQVVNRKLKVLAEIAGIDKTISSHDMRHTFATYLNSIGIPLHSIKELMGHSDIKQTLDYIHSTKETVSKHLRDAKFK